MDDMFRQLAKVADGSAAKGNGQFDVRLATDDEEDFAYDNLISPKIKPQKSEEGSKTILVVDDDFATLDLMKIYLQREFSYVCFDNPKDAIFWINTHVPDLIFIDCYLTMISTRRVIDIIKTYKELEEVPIYYLSEPDELGAVSGKLPEGVKGVISRPVGRGDLQEVLNCVFAVNAEEDEENKE